MGNTVNAQALVRGLIQEFGENPDREGLRETPKRVVKAYEELTSGYAMDPAEILSKTFEADYDEMVIVKGIEFWSLCEHHLLPFHGTCTVGYIPKGRVVGLSKVARVVHCFARRFQIQEKMTAEIGTAIFDALNPRGVAVVVKAEHTCMQMRGIKTAGAMITSALFGIMKEDGRARSEFMRLAVGK